MPTSPAQRAPPRPRSSSKRWPASSHPRTFPRLEPRRADRISTTPPNNQGADRPGPGRGRALPHTFIVSSDEARFLLVTKPAGLEELVRALAEPALRLEIPPTAT